MANDEKKKKNLTLPLPLSRDLIVEILLRLPVRSLLRLKCVCRSFFFFISDPQFAKYHFDLSAEPTHRLLLRFLNEDKVESFDLDSSLDDNSAVVTLNLPPPCMSCDQNSLKFLGSCRGLMLLAYEYKRLIVWNPCTGFHKQILTGCDFLLGSLYGLGYDNSTDDYFVVIIGLVWSNAKIRTFSVKTNSWDYNCVNFQYTDLGYHYRHGVFLNNSLHWLVLSTDAGILVVIAFDLLEKGLLEIPLSPELAKPVLTADCAPKFYHVRVLGGCLSLCYAGGRLGRAEIWVMKEYKVQSSWTKAFVVTDYDIPGIHFYPIRFIEGGGVFGSNGNGRLMKFNAEGKLLEHHKYREEIENVQKYFGMFRESDFKNIQIYFEMYTESLLLFPGEQPLLRDKKEAMEDEEEGASGLQLHSVKSLTCDFKEAAEEVVEASDDDIEEESEEESTEDKEATEDEEEESTEDDNI